MDIAKLLDGVDWRRIESLKVIDLVVYATHEGYIHLGEESLRVFQLSNGERVFDMNDIARLLGMEPDEVAEHATRRTLADD